VTITEPAILSVTLDSVYAVKCFGDSTGAAFITISGGTAPVSVMWDNNASTEDITGLAAGTYVATLIDANNCSASISASISQPAAALTATTVVTDQIQGGALGAINVTISGGTGPYTSSWNGGITTEDRTGLAAGVYISTITDANGCTTTISDTVDLITTLESIGSAFAISLYPNPSQDKVFLDLMLNQATNVAVEIFNVEGQLVQLYTEKNMLSSKLEMNFSLEAAGVYYAKIKVGDTTINRKIVITR
jgi:hypothetical protein